MESILSERLLELYVPCWLVGLIVTWVTAVGLIIAQWVYGKDPLSFLGTDFTHAIFSPESGEVLDPYGFVVSVMCFLMRDIALLLYVYFSTSRNAPLRSRFGSPVV